MKNIDCVIVYFKVEDKLVPEIFYELDEAKKFLEKVEE
jgi:hypothetical protein